MGSFTTVFLNKFFLFFLTNDCFLTCLILKVTVGIFIFISVYFLKIIYNLIYGWYIKIPKALTIKETLHIMFFKVTFLTKRPLSETFPL